MNTHQKFSRRQGHHSAVTTLSFGYCHHLRFGSFLLNSAPGRCSKLNERFGKFHSFRPVATILTFCTKASLDQLPPCISFISLQAGWELTNFGTWTNLRGHNWVRNPTEEKF
ncbi:hypothetical protein WN943_023819 [Citrus x changshan-huyou]